MTSAIDTAFNARRYVWLHGAGFTFMGFVVAVSGRLVLFQRFADFTPNGYVILPRAAIQTVDSDAPPLHFFEEMMRKEGLLEKLGPPYPIALDSMASAARAIQQRGDLVMIHKGEFEDAELELDVGEVISADDLHLRLWFLTATGAWDGESVVNTPQIARLEFASPYLVALKKYSGARK